MLIEFRVKNYGCLRDEQALSFVPASCDPTLLNLSFARFYTNNGSDHSACFRLPTPFGDSFGGIAWGTFLRHG